jgi:hypothetical protein
MNATTIVSLCQLMPLMYGGLYTLAHPASSIRVVNKVMADAHRIEANTLLGDLFAEPTPIADSRAARAYLRLAGLAILAAGLIRLYSL